MSKVRLNLPEMRKDPDQRRLLELFEAFMTFCYHDVLELDKSANRVLNRDEIRILIELTVDDAVKMMNRKEMMIAGVEGLYNLYFKEKKPLGTV